MPQTQTQFKFVAEENDTKTLKIGQRVQIRITEPWTYSEHEFVVGQELAAQYSGGDYFNTHVIGIVNSLLIPASHLEILSVSKMQVNNCTVKRQKVN